MIRLISCFLFLLPSLISAVGDLDKVHATGKGIVKLGDDLKLTYQVGHEWDRCYWYWYETKDEFFYCSYDQDPDDHSVEKHRCNSDELNKEMEYTGTNKDECTVTVHNVTELDNCKWAVRLDTDMNTKVLDIIVAKEVEDISLYIGANKSNFITVGEPGLINCTIKGGRPAPLITMDVGQMTKNDSNQSQTPDDDGVFMSYQELYVTPKIEDHGAKVKCSAALFDGDNKLLFPVKNSEDFVLNVTFPPQKVAEQVVTVKEGEDAFVSFVFQSNPSPTSIEWKIRNVIVSDAGNDTNTETTSDEGKADAEESTGEEPEQNESEREATTTTTEAPTEEQGEEEPENTITITPGHDDDKYMASEIQVEDGLKSRVNLTIKGVQPEDIEKKNYSLVAQNAFGSQKYTFQLKLDTSGGGNGGEDSSTTPITTTTIKPETTTAESSVAPSSNGGIIFAIVALVVITVIIVGSIIVYKKKNARNETAPLSTMERRP